MRRRSHVLQLYVFFCCWQIHGAVLQNRVEKPSDLWHLFCSAQAVLCIVGSIPLDLPLCIVTPEDQFTSSGAVGKLLESTEE